jgi:nitrous oxidase accessory protein NosD
MLALEAWAMVSIDPPLPNNVRSEPGSSSKVIGMVQPGEILQITDGPQCADGYTWWYIHSADGLDGWTAEGDAGGYWIVPLQPVVDWGTEQNTVTLTAGQVRSAFDIESAIHNATARGTRPGIVILDGRNGTFVFTEPDRSINVFVSNLALVGVNHARIQGCGDGLFFDNLPLRNILVEGIEFVCDGHGIWTNSAFDSVILRNNVFRTGSTAITMGGASSNWVITHNQIVTEAEGIKITAGKKFILANNDITAGVGIILRQCYDFQVLDNLIRAADTGVQLIQKAARNVVQKNTIQGVRLAGIWLETGVTDNLILENRVSCAPGTSCKTVEASPAALEANTISGNTP